jgi:hypothetical protein
MHPADVASLDLLLDVFMFGSADLKSASSIWGTCGSAMLPNQDYREDGEESPSAKCSRGSLRCKQSVAGHCSATAVLQIEEAP